MGIFLSISGQVDVSDVFVDFENASYIDESEQAICEAAGQVLSSAPSIIKLIGSYESCGNHIRKALSNPNPEFEFEAFEAVKANVALVQVFFNFSKDIANVARELLKKMATGKERDSFTQHQFTVKQFALLIDFVLCFDEIKMGRPGIQNDFSYYRRVLGKHSNDPDLQVRDEEASFISLFIAQPTPMMSSLAKATSSLYVSNPNVPQAIALVANICLEFVKTKRFASQDTNILLIRVMIGSIVLFDHISLEGGAFVKASGINVKQAIKLALKECSPTSPLVNFLRFSTLHLNDSSTPSSIREMLQAGK